LKNSRKKVPNFIAQKVPNFFAGKPGKNAGNLLVPNVLILPQRQQCRQISF
jgi:hypothetical protein